MRHEAIFSKNGFYEFVLSCNVLMHREAVKRASEVIGRFLRTRPSKKIVAVLDLACGGTPVTISSVLSNCAPQAFTYTGIDINPDQVEVARSTHAYPKNVTRVHILEGNAWDMGTLALDGPYDVVFSVMNLHHGTPEEIYYLGQQLRELLSDGGLFISHDVYRPANELYQRRPSANPTNTAESFRLVDEAALSQAKVPTFALPAYVGSSEPVWRSDYFERMRCALIDRGADAAGAEATTHHMRERDYPVSVSELCMIFERLGFKTRGLRYEHSKEPLAPYIAMSVASKGSLAWL